MHQQYQISSKEKNKLEYTLLLKFFKKIYIQSNDLHYYIIK